VDGVTGEGAPRVGYQGEPGAFGEAAIARWWDGRAEAVPMPTFEHVADAVAAGVLPFGVLPVENSIAGRVAAAEAALADEGHLEVVGEVRLAVDQCLLALPGASLDALESVSSHPVALAQCGRFLRAHPWLRVEVVEDTAGAARMVAAAGDPRRAAIAGRAAAGRHGLAVLVADVHDRADNETRFVIIAPAGHARGRDGW